MHLRLTVAALTLLLATPAFAQPIPQLALWEAHMTSAGQAVCDFLGGGATQDAKLNYTYYDSIRVFYQIADYTADPKWNACALRARAVFRDAYVMTAACWPSGFGAVPGYWNFTTGERMDFERTGDVTSKNAVNAQANCAAYSTDSDWNAPETANPWLSRESSYALVAHLNQEQLGFPVRASTAGLLTKVLAHIDAWFGSKSARCPSVCDVPAAVGQYYVQPFMVALSMQALIKWHEEKGPDPRIQPAIKQAVDWLWANAWVPADQAFWYDNWVPNPAVAFPARAGSADLNLLIAPAFAWLYKQTGDVTYRDRGDLIFAGGVVGAYLGAGKQFDQNYIYSFDYVKWRGAAAPPPAATATGTLSLPPVTGVGLPSAVTFAAQAVATTSPAQNVSVSNTGLVDLAITPTITAPFAISVNGCDKASDPAWDGYLTPKATCPACVCVLSVTFTPSVPGPVSGVLTILATPRVAKVPQPPTLGPVR